MAEETLVRDLIKGMKRRWRHPVKHNDPFTSGVADVSAWIDGPGNVWIELKSRRSWPKRPGTPVKFDLRDDQKLFLLERKGWCLCRVARDYFLFNWEDSYWLVNHMSRQEMFSLCSAHWAQSIDWGEFAGVISHEGKTTRDIPRCPEKGQALQGCGGCDRNPGVVGRERIGGSEEKGD